jgi:hypothetical protein
LRLGLSGDHYLFSAGVTDFTPTAISAIALEPVLPLCQPHDMTGSEKIARLVISLDEVKRPVSRRIEVLLGIRLDRLHGVLQIVMGWESYHLSEFRVARNIA